MSKLNKSCVEDDDEGDACFDRTFVEPIPIQLEGIKLTIPNAFEHSPMVKSVVRCSCLAGIGLAVAVGLAVLLRGAWPNVVARGADYDAFSRDQMGGASWTSETDSLLGRGQTTRIWHAV